MEILAYTPIASRTGQDFLVAGGLEGIGFALPAAVVRELLPSQRFELTVWSGSGIPIRFGRSHAEYQIPLSAA